MKGKALGIIETKGLLTALEAADAAVKAAAVELIGYELAGGGLAMVKFTGEVGAVNAAVEAGVEAAKRLVGVAASRVIARPHEDLEKLILTEETVGKANK